MCKSVRIVFNHEVDGENLEFNVDFTAAYNPHHRDIQPEGPEMNILSVKKNNGDFLNEEAIALICENDSLWNELLLVAEEIYNEGLERKLS